MGRRSRRGRGHVARRRRAGRLAPSGLRGAGRRTRGRPTRSRVLDLPSGSLPVWPCGPAARPTRRPSTRRRRARGRRRPSAPSPPPSPRTGWASCWSASCPGAPRSCAPRSPHPWRWGAPTRTRRGGCTSGPMASRTARVPSAAAGADCAVHGSAADLYLALGIARSPTRSSSRATGTCCTMFLDTVRVRWS